MASVKVKSRLEIVRWAIATLPPLVESAGTYHPADSRTPASWRLNDKGCQIILTINVLCDPVDPDLSSLLDVWQDVGGKVLSVSWCPNRPWAPPYVGRLSSGDWMYRLGWKGSQ